MRVGMLIGCTVSLLSFGMLATQPAQAAKEIGGLDLYKYCETVGKNNYGERFYRINLYTEKAPRYESADFRWKCTIDYRPAFGLINQSQRIDFDYDAVCRAQYDTYKVTTVSKIKNKYDQNSIVCLDRPE
jgi:hypothetical protein